MAIMQIEVNPESLWQSQTLILPGKETMRVNFELRYLPKTDLWYMSMTDVQSGKSYFRYVPLLATRSDYPTSLVEPFWHEGIGVILCLPLTDNPTTENPSKDNLNEFAIVWGDGNGE